MGLLKDAIIMLKEEESYNEGVLEHKKRLEATLWGLEEQSSFPENAGKEDQEQISEEANRCRAKILNCNKLLSAHDFKIKQLLRNFLGNESK